MINNALSRARSHAPFLRFQLERRPDLAAALENGALPQALADDVDTMAALRRERSAVALVLGIGDLAGLLSLEEVTATLSDLADRSLDRAVRTAIEERTPGEAVRGFAVISLGKHGARELNYSSDVDVIFLYDPATLPKRAREDAGQAALRIGQRVVELLQKRTEDGYAFRVDLRLRPSPEVTPIVLPVDAAISHYESSALPWERAAFIRARFVAGDAQVGRYFLDSVHPFVWRRSLDFGAVAEITGVTARIRDHYADRQAFGPGYDLKRGRGGIREIEFFAQVHQLIHGGRDPALRASATMPALHALADAGLIAQGDAVQLAAAYRVLRTIEHRLQMVDDRQTHSLPTDGQALTNVAQLHGLADGNALLALLQPHVAQVATVYGRLADAAGAGGDAGLPQDAMRLTETLDAAGFADTEAARARIEGWRTGSARALRTPAARAAFEGMLPTLIAAFGAAPDPLRALNRFDDVVRRLPSGINFFRLLRAKPGLTEHLGELLSHAPALADQLARRPELIEGLIDASAFAPPPDMHTMAEAFARPERADEDYQMILDRVRRRVNEVRFALGAQLVLGLSDPLEVAAGYARVAEAAVQVLAGEATRAFEATHGRVPGSELLILGMGRLGGRALTHASDLDLVYLFSGTHEAESDGPKPLRANDYFNRLAPRVTAALSVPTAAGPLYEVDTRLRPSGRDGMLAVSVPAFAEYQHERAWTFEHMALTRARPIFGSANARDQLARVVEGVLLIAREPEKIVIDALAMRAEIALHKTVSGPFDIKLGDGGLVDLEFAVQVLQLTHRTGLISELGPAIDALVAEGLVPSEIADAHRLLARMLVVLRLVSPDSAEPPPSSRSLVARACQAESWDALLLAHDAARLTVATLWTDVRAGASA